LKVNLTDFNLNHLLLLLSLKILQNTISLSHSTLHLSHIFGETKGICSLVYVNFVYTSFQSVREIVRLKKRQINFRSRTTYKTWTWGYFFTARNATSQRL